MRGEAGCTGQSDTGPRAPGVLRTAASAGESGSQSMKHCSDNNPCAVDIRPSSSTSTGPIVERDVGQAAQATADDRPGADLRREVSLFFSAGQAMVEFAFVAGLLLLIALVGIQFAIIGNAALAVNQCAYSVARYASVNYQDQNLGNPNSDAQVQALIPPAIGGTGSSGTALATIALTPCAAPPNNFGSVTTVTVTYDLVGGKKIFLPNPFSIVSGVLNANVGFPTTVSATQSAFCE
jgi:TadE-like protein